MHSEPILKPLRETADRVGREVEIFAEKLDTWKTNLGADQQSRRKAAFGLVDDYRSIAWEAVKRLEKDHEAERNDAFSSAWRQAQNTLRKELKKPTLVQAEHGARPRTRPHGRTSFGELQRWQSELDTWRLLADMLPFLYPDPDPESGVYVNMLKDGRFEADGRSFHDFISGDAVARERLVILRWLENIAESTNNDDIGIIEDELEKSSGRGKGLWAHGWLDTREKIKGEKRLRLWDNPVASGLPEIKNTEGTELLITQLDPDAATRQDRNLEVSDSSFEDSFWIMAWEMFRRGTSLEEIRDWCQDRNQFARAQSMGAHHTDAYKQPSSKVVNARLRWRRTCRYAAKNGGMNAHERAVFGLMSGDFKAMEPVCASWDDFLYANLNTLLLAQYDAYVRKEFASLVPKNGEQNYGVVPGMPSAGESGHLAVQRVVHSLQHNPKSRITTEHPYKCIQSTLVEHIFGEFIFRQGVALSRRVIESRRDEAVLELIPGLPATYLPETKINLLATDPDILRVMVHILVIFQLLGLKFGNSEREMASENIFAAYIDVLRQANKLDPLPVYASSMSQERAEITMARVLPAIVNPGERMEYIQLMKSMNIDIYQVLTFQYEFALEASTLPDDTTANVAPLTMLLSTKDDMWPGQRIRSLRIITPLNSEDEYIIRSMEWWLLVDGEWELTFASLTDVAKQLLCSGRLDALMALYERLPFSAVSTAKTPSILGKQVDILQDYEGSDEDEAPALQRTTRTKSALTIGPTRAPMPPRKLKAVRDLLKRQSKTYIELGQMNAAMTSLWKWRRVEDEYINQSLNNADSSTARQSARKHLDGLVTDMQWIMASGYLMDAQNESEAKDLKAIRETFLPDLVIAFNSALHSAAHLISRDHLLQSLDLATEVAENEELVRCFTASGKIGQLVDAFALSSKAILKLNEHASKGAKKRRGRAGQSLGIWDVEA